MNKVFEDANQGSNQYSVILEDVGGVKCSVLNYPWADTLPEASKKAIALAKLQFPEVNWMVSFIFEGRQDPLHTSNDFPLDIPSD